MPQRDQVRYQVVLGQNYDVQSVEVHMKDGSWQSKMDKHAGTVYSMVNHYLDNDFHKVVNKQIKVFNDKVLNGDTFISYHFGSSLPLNVTSTKYP